MTFHDAHERVKALGFGLSYDAAQGHWRVFRRRMVVHQASDPEEAVQFCEAWSEHVR